MYRFTFISDAGVSTKLCESTRSLAESNLRLNGKPVIQIESLAGNEDGFQLGIYRGNQRNTISFDVKRAQDFAGNEFSSAEAAFVFALDHVDHAGGAMGTNEMGGSGELKMEFTNGSYSATRYMHNALVENKEMTDAKLGICLGFSYVINGGVINGTA